MPGNHAEATEGVASWNSTKLNFEAELGNLF